jgi:hypothetical protein
MIVKKYSNFGGVRIASFQKYNRSAKRRAVLSDFVNALSLRSL